VMCVERGVCVCGVCGACGCVCGVCGFCGVCVFSRVCVCFVWFVCVSL